MTHTLTPDPSERLLVLLRYAKSENTGSGWRDIASALGDLYHPEMTLPDVIHHVVSAFTEVLCEPRFEIGRGGSAGEELLLAPIKGYHAIEIYGPKSLETQYTVEQFYNAQISYVVGQLSIARIDWCRSWYYGTLSSQSPLEAIHV